MKKTLFLLLTSALLVSSCDGDNGFVIITANPDQVRPGGTDNCKDDCKIDDVVCDEEGTKFCGYFDGDPCLDWSQGIQCDCGCDGNECKSNCPVVEDTCKSDCTEEGNTKCAGTLISTCQKAEADCLKWSEPESCGTGKACDLGECKETGNACEDTCIKDTVECTNTGRRKCAIGSDGCTAWTSLDGCADGTKCQNGECIEDLKDACTLDAIQCDGTKYRKCITGPKGVTVWGDATDCDPGSACVGNQCTVQIKDECTQGAKECSGTGFRECIKGTSGFTEWSSVTPCGDKQKCEGGTCVAKCTDACSTGKTKCSSDNKGYQKCETGSEGCMVWSSAVTSCKAGCENGACKPDPDAWIPECTSNCPTVIRKFPYVVTGDNSSAKNTISTYSCASDIDESGPEDTYIFKVNEPGYVIAGVTDKGSKDVDIQLLKSRNSAGCLDRGDRYVMKHVNAGVYYITVDSYKGASNSGKYQLAVQFLADSGKCGLKPTSVERVGGRSTVNLPAIGNVVLEAHLVTEHDRQVHGKNWWPSSFTDGIATHKAYTKSLYPDVINTQSEPWCPNGEGGCQYGQGSVANQVPDDAEAWYVCMYWKSTSRPKAGTRFLVVNPFNGKAVVSAAGYETGPGDENKIGGAVDEVHYYLGTAGDSPRRIMFSQMTDANQSTKFGPITCDYQP